MIVGLPGHIYDYRKPWLNFAVVFLCKNHSTILKPCMVGCRKGMQKKNIICKTGFLDKEQGLNVFKKLDSITYKHSTNVAYYAVRFAKYVVHNYNESLIYYSGLLHDIGKTQIDVKILNKSSTLNKDEFDIIKQHPSIGYNILQKTDIHEEVLEAVLLHHERYDGEGYPRGIKAGNIPLIARIISICDVYDALTSDRSYRTAYAIDEALQIMINSAGQFDPELFTIFNSELSKIAVKK